MAETLAAEALGEGADVHAATSALAEAYDAHISQEVLALSREKQIVVIRFSQEQVASQLLFKATLAGRFQAGGLQKNVEPLSHLFLVIRSITFLLLKKLAVPVSKRDALDLQLFPNQIRRK